MNPQAIAAIAGTLMGGIIGFVTAFAIEERRWKHRKTELFIQYLADIGAKRIEAYHFLISQLTVLEEIFRQAADDPALNSQLLVQKLEAFIKEATPYFFLLSEEIEEQIREVFLKLLHIARTSFDYKTISSFFSSAIRPLITAMRKDILEIQKKAWSNAYDKSH